jgi:hypothetical protein
MQCLQVQLIVGFYRYAACRRTLQASATAWASQKSFLWPCRNGFAKVGWHVFDHTTEREDFTGQVVSGHPGFDPD